ncbi:MAG: hypothetical protein GY832_16165 [Chloroflexi bacterium]|nr:hypothetical protein [Chloroflexota bacterium]
MRPVITTEDVEKTTETQCRPIIYPDSPIGEIAQVEGGQVNVELLLLIDDNVVQFAPSPSSPGLPRWCIAWVSWAGDSGMRGGGSWRWGARY